ncbi:MAG: DNA repair protein RecO [Armatimonadota bacterium]|nr:DNA repair protein RecO [Armatimonadota bacterium]MDR7519181.1 DNA repair protein RecO [Armatimonadota bacterium]MDR7550990.1 DNA repair protein RecO [Armatimonadota bacterium]
MGVYTIEGIVLRRRNLGEADRLVVVLTRDRGKLAVAARGARRPRSRLAGRLEPATRFRALVAEGRTLDVISQVEVLDAHAALRSDLERMGTAAVILELADRALAERHPHPDVYRLLRRALDLVDAGAGETAWMWFAARLLAATGHRPAVERCAVCGRRLRAPVVWSASQGGCLHAGCGAKDPQAVPVAQSAVALLAFLLDARPAAVARVAPAPRDLAAASEALRGYAEARWEVRLRAPGIVGRLRASTRAPAAAAAPPRTERRAPVV